MNPIKKPAAAISLAMFLCFMPVLAANNVSEIDIDVCVRNDGSAYIVQNWHGEFYEGTENYIPITTHGISISDFTVSDKDGTYAFADNWNIDASFDEKIRKCGINETADGVELCFGISEYGENRYAIEYVVTDFIKSYTDCDGTNFMFINPNMSTFPTDGHINITLENGIALTEDNSRIWAFGYDGNVEFQNGAVSAYTTNALKGDDSMIVMLELNCGLISPRTETGISFETVKNNAFEDSDYDYYNEDGDYDYEDVGVFGTIVGFLILLAVPTLVVLTIVFLIKRKREIRKFYKETEYFRDVPNGGKIEVSHYLAQNFDVSGDESLIIGTLMLSMINKGVLEPQLEKDVGFFGKTKESVNLKLIKEPGSPSELSLYRLISASAGDDGILQEKELEKYSYKHPGKINDFLSAARKNGETEFASDGGFAGFAGNRIKNLSDKGKSELAEIMGLKKYLEDFTLISERDIAETVIWQDYIIYATLFGIADKVINQLKKLYPEKLPELENYNRNVVIANSYYHSMYMSSQKAIQARRSSGGGGHASFGGGGGFSGGGHGGGSR